MAKKSFNVKLKELGFNSAPGAAQKIRQYLLGKKVEIIASTGGHNYGPVGTKLIFDNPSMYPSGGNGNKYSSISAATSGKNNISFTCFTVIEEENIEDLQENISKIKQEIGQKEQELSLEQSKIEYLKETGSEFYKENEFKVYSTLTLLEDDSLSKIEKAKLVAGLIDN